MNWLKSISKEKIESENLPLKEILDNSFYYPASGTDGGPVKFFSNEFDSFIYVDYHYNENRFLDEFDSFNGYHVLGHRSVLKDELIPLGWTADIPTGKFSYKYPGTGSHIDNWIAESFAHWTIYERNQDFDDNHGPERFSLLFISGEGVATYQALYTSNNARPKGIGIIQPGTGFGGNWTDFRDDKYPFGQVVKDNPAGMPDVIFYGGYGSGYGNPDKLKWEGYCLTDIKINPYYHGISGPFGELVVYKNENFNKPFKSKKC